MFRPFYIRQMALILGFVLCAVLVTGVLSLFGISLAYTENFTKAANAMEQSDLPQRLQSILVTEEGAEIDTAALEKTVLQGTDTLKLSDSRCVYVLSARDCSVIYPTHLRPQTLAVTDNLYAAKRGANGRGASLFSAPLDYALFLANGATVQDGYILYLRDDKADLYAALKETALFLLWALLAGVLLSLLAGFIMVKRTMKPVGLLAKRAERFARGNFEPSLEKLPPGELSALGRSFDRIGTLMNNNLTQINAEKHKIEAILEHINNGILAFDTEQNMIHINPAAKRMLRIENTEGLQFDRLFRSLDAGVCMAEFLYLDRDKLEKRDLLVDTNHIKAYFVPFMLDANRTAGVICVLEDVTEAFTLESARQKFVAEVSHELKTPLTTIRTYTETLLNGYLDDKRTATAFLTTVQNETDKMTALVQNLLILNRFDMQRVQMEREWFSVDEMLRDQIKTFQLEAEQKGIAMTYNRVTEIPLLYADYGQIERAIRNIVSNAIKYSSKGDKIQIFAGSLYDNKLYIKVEDTGKGIPKSDLEHVFERFYRVDKARSRDRGGTGLGLAICKEIIESHGGTIEIESEFGKFTRVTVNLPTHVKEDDENPDESQEVES